MRQYLDTVANVLENGTYKPNRTAVDTISNFSQHYTIDVSDSFPLLTTKQMSDFRWKSMVRELLWFLSGEEHIRNLRDHTSIWDAWADKDGHLDSAYGRFWRRYPIPDEDSRLEGENWPDADGSWVNAEQTEDGTERRTFDQLQYVIDQLNENPMTRRLVVTAWHPANTADSTLPACHYTFVFNVQGDGTLNLHLTQRSADIALGVPFNIAEYSLLLKMVAQQTGFEPGEFSHELVDAHIYAGTGERGEWYGENLDELQKRVKAVRTGAEAHGVETYTDIAEWIEETAPEGELSPRGKPYDHVPGMLRQLDRDPLEPPEVEIADKPIGDIGYDDITLKNYNSHDGIDFGIAE